MWPKVLSYILLPLHSHGFCGTLAFLTLTFRCICICDVCVFSSHLFVLARCLEFFMHFSGSLQVYVDHLITILLSSPLFFFWFHGFHPSFPVTLAFQDKLCLPHHILEGKGLTKVGFTVQALVDRASSRRDQRRSPC